MIRAAAGAQRDSGRLWLAQDGSFCALNKMKPPAGAEGFAPEH